MKKLLLILSFAIFLTACTSTAEEQPTQTALPATSTFTETPLPTETSTPTLIPTSTITSTPTITFTPTITPTATFAFPSVTVNVAQAHCRYGPNVAYLHAADLYEGDTGTVRSRWYLSKWLLVKFDKLDYFCWVAPSVVDVSGDVESVVSLTELNLTSIGSNQYGPPENVVATRNGNKMTITWNQMKMTEDKDRGYFLDLFVCQGGDYLWWPISFPDQYTTSYTVKDEAGCHVPSNGVIYTVEKHGYSQTKTITWPSP